MKIVVDSGNIVGFFCALPMETWAKWMQFNFSKWKLHWWKELLLLASSWKLYVTPHSVSLIVPCVIAPVWKELTETELRCLLEVGDWWKTVSMDCKQTVLCPDWDCFEQLKSCSDISVLWSMYLKNQIDYSLFKCQSTVLNINFFLLVRIVNQLQSLHW